MRFSKVISLISAICLSATSVLSGGTVGAVAQSKTHKIVDLIHSGKVKTFGRYREEDEKMTSYWSANGFEINVKAKSATTLRVICSSNATVFLAAFVDGKQQDRESAISPQITDLFVEIPKGEHTVRVLRDSPITNDAFAYFYFESIEFEGEILKANKNTDFYLEVIGDSIACGNGSLGTFLKGQAWKNPDDHSAVKGFGYRIAEELGCDYSLVCRGGIGLLKDTSGSQEEQSVKTKVTMDEIYNLTNAYVDLNNNAEEYSFERKPNLILLELGANDNAQFEDMWEPLLVDFIKQLRQKNGENVPIVWVGKNLTHFSTVKRVIASTLSDDKNLYAFQFNYGGSGSAALSTQTAGHPSSLEQKAFANEIMRFLKRENLVPEKVTETKPEKNTETNSTEKIPLKNVGLLAGGAAALGLVAGVAVSVFKRKKKK